MTPTPTAAPLIAPITGFVQLEEPQRDEAALVPVAAVGLAHDTATGGDVAVGVERRVAATEIRARAEAPAAAGHDDGTRTSGSASTSSTTAHSSRCIVTVNALSRSGRSSVMVATWSATSYAICE